jgi:hypothetical protein
MSKQAVSNKRANKPNPLCGNTGLYGPWKILELVSKIGFERARLQPCRKEPGKIGALAPAVFPFVASGILKPVVITEY